MADLVNGDGIVVATASETVVSEEPETPERLPGERSLLAGNKALNKGSGQRGKSVRTAVPHYHSYLVKRMEKGASRQAALEQVEYGIRTYAPDLIAEGGKKDEEEFGNKLLKAGFAMLLLDPEETACLRDDIHGCPVEISWSHWSRVFSQLVDRANPDTTNESYVLLPGFEDQCRNAFKHCVEANLGRDDCLPIVHEVTDAFTVLRHDAAVELSEKLEAAQETAKAASGRAVENASGIRKQLKEALSDEVKARLRAELKAAIDEQGRAADALKAARKELTAANEEKKFAERAFERMEKRNAPKKAASTKKHGTKDEPQSETAALDQVIASIREGTAKDSADMLLGFICDPELKERNLIAVELVIAMSKCELLLPSVRNALKLSLPAFTKIEMESLQNAA